MIRRLPTVALASSLLAAAWAANAQTRPVGQAVTPPGAAYSAGVLANGTLYVSGLQGVDPRTHKLPGDFATEVKTCLDNVGVVLKDAHMSYSDVVSVQIYLVDMSQFDQVNAIYQSYFKHPYPARTTVAVSKLSAGAHVEIAAVAQTGSARGSKPH